MADNTIYTDKMTSASGGQTGLFQTFQKNRKEPPWFADLRLKAFDRYSRMRWPTPQEEEWRRTDVTGIDFNQYKVNDATGGAPGREENTAGEKGEACPKDWGGFASFTDSDRIALALKEEYRKKGVILASLDRALQERNGAFHRIFSQGIERLDNRFQAWHYSFMTNGIYLHVPSFLEIDEPFIFDFTIPGRESEEGGKILSAPHVVIQLDQGARAVVIARTQSRDEGEVLYNIGADIRVGASAGLHVYQVQELNEKSLYFSHGRATVARDGLLHCFDASFGSRLLKSRLDCSLEGPGSEALLEGLYFPAGEQHMDIRTVQRHEAPRTNSRAYYKGAVKDGAWSIYQGLIEVNAGAAKTDAYLTDKNLILNDGARADSIPSLRINTDDVRCSHGSTTGRINPEEVFYLMSRGLSRQEAEKMLVLGFFEELLEKTPAYVGDGLRSLIQARLRGGI